MTHRYPYNYGSSFGLNRCEHDGAQLIVGPLQLHIEACSMFGESLLLDMVLSLREHFKMQDVIRICTECLCVTTLDGEHAERASVR
jgi:hypothetical protein